MAHATQTALPVIGGMYELHIPDRPKFHGRQGVVLRINPKSVTLQEMGTAYTIRVSRSGWQEILKPLAEDDVKPLPEPQGSQVRRATEVEERLIWAGEDWGDNPTYVLDLPDGSLLVSLSDEEGNGPGVFMRMRPDGTQHLLL